MTRAIVLEPIRRREREAFLAMFAPYHDELDAYDDAPADGTPIERYAAYLNDPHEHDACWIIDAVDGDRAGFVVLRYVPDWPDVARLIAEVAELYVLPAARRRGVAAAAVEAASERARAGGAQVIEAGILARNGPAWRFWERMGFTTRSVRTAREL